jgi:hypothetical protein
LGAAFIWPSRGAAMCLDDPRQRNRIGANHNFGHDAFQNRKIALPAGSISDQVIH